MFFIVNVDLSEEGIDHVDDIVTLVFQYLNMLRADGPQEWVFEECKKLGLFLFNCSRFVCFCFFQTIFTFELGLWIEKSRGYRSLLGILALVEVTHLHIGACW